MAKSPKKGKAEKAKPQKPKAETKPRKHKPHRPHVKYNPELGDIICWRIANGETLRQVCRDEGMPTEAAVRAWALNPDHPFFSQYARAKELFYHGMAEELIEIADDGTNDWMVREREDGSSTEIVNHEHIQRSRLRFEARRWLLSKALPKIYGDKIALTDPDGGTLKVEFVA